MTSHLEMMAGRYTDIIASLCENFIHHIELMLILKLFGMSI